jgi:hypothetical protein
MDFSKEDIARFIEAYEKDFGETIDYATAEEMASRLTMILLHVSRIPPSKRAQQPDAPTSE